MPEASISTQTHTPSLPSQDAAQQPPVSQRQTFAMALISRTSVERFFGQKEMIVLLTAVCFQQVTALLKNASPCRYLLHNNAGVIDCYHGNTGQQVSDLTDHGS